MPNVWGGGIGQIWPGDLLLPGGGGGAGAVCPAADQAKPHSDGDLLVGASCPTCSDKCPPADGDGTQPPPGCAVHGPNGELRSGPITLSASTSGVSPLTLDFTVNLSIVPPGRRIVAVEVQYLNPRSGSVISDNFGVADSGQLVRWNVDGIKAVNAARLGPGAISVHAVSTFPPPGSAFSAQRFIVHFLEPVDYP